MIALARSAERRERHRRAHFWDKAQKYIPALGVDDRLGNRYFVSTSDYGVGRQIFVHGAFDPETLDSVVTILSRRGLIPEQIIDVGANIGPTTIDFLTRFPDATAVAFEPDAANFRLFTQNLLCNDLSGRVVTYEAAASDIDGSVTLELSAENHGDHRVRVAERPGDLKEELRATRTIPAWRLDTLLERGEISLDRLTLLWIDAQGHEAQILAGATRLRNVPTVVEFWPYGLKRADGYEQFLEVARSYATVFEIGAHPRVIPQSDLSALGAEVEARDPWPWTDLLLFPQPTGGPADPAGADELRA